MNPYTIPRSMTPREYLDWYENLTVPLVSGAVVTGVDCHEYRINTHSSDPDHRASAGQVAWNNLHRALLRHGLRNHPVFHFDLTGEEADERELRLVFQGKGTPEGIIQVLRLANAVGLVQGTRAALNDYCTLYLGIDCSGFVTNYLRHNGRADLPREVPAKYYRHHGQLRARLEWVRPGDVMAFTQTNHVVLIDRVDPFIRSEHARSAVDCHVAESAGSRLESGNMHTDGLHCTRYTLSWPRPHTDCWFWATRSGHEWDNATGGHSSYKVVVRRFL